MEGNFYIYLFHLGPFKVGLHLMLLWLITVFFNIGGTS